MNALDQIGIRVLESASVKTKSYAIFAQPLRLSKTSLAFPNDETVLEDGSSKMTGAHELPARGGQAVGRADACHNGKSDKTDPAVFPYPRDLTRAARKPPRCSPVFMSRSRHDAPIRLLLPGAASRAVRVPVGCLPGLFCQTERLPQHPLHAYLNPRRYVRAPGCAPPSSDDVPASPTGVRDLAPGNAHRFVYCTVPFKDTIDADSR